MVNQKQTIDFATNPEDFESYFERAIEEGSFDARVERHMICKQFSDFEKEFYQNLYEAECNIYLDENNCNPEFVDAFIDRKKEFKNSFDLDEEHYMIFVYAKQCSAFQKDLILNDLDIDQLETDEDTEKLVELFIKNYRLLALIPPSIPLLGRYAYKQEDLFIAK